MKLLRDTDQGLQDLGRLEVQWASSYGSVALSGPGGCLVALPPTP